MSDSNEACSRDIEKLADCEAAAMASGDIDAYCALLHENAIFLPPNSLPKEGVELRDWMSDFLLNYKIEWNRYIHDEVVVFGEYAYHRYSYSWRVIPRSSSKSILAQGKGVHVMRRSAIGNWKLFREIWNSNPSS